MQLNKLPISSTRMTRTENERSQIVELKSAPIYSLQIVPNDTISVRNVLRISCVFLFDLSVVNTVFYNALIFIKLNIHITTTTFAIDNNPRVLKVMCVLK